MSIGKNRVGQGGGKLGGDNMKDPWVALKNTSGFGSKMMEQMGWEAGKGLGANEDGRKTAITVTKREAGLGLGVGSLDHARSSQIEKGYKDKMSTIKIGGLSDSDSDNSDSEDSSDEDEDDRKEKQLIALQSGNCATEDERKLLAACGGRGAGGGQGGSGGAGVRAGKLKRCGTPATWTALQHDGPNHHGV